MVVTPALEPEAFAPNNVRRWMLLAESHATVAICVQVIPFPVTEEMVFRPSTLRLKTNKTISPSVGGVHDEFA